ncbi:hypothetical protein [Desulfoscipio gibsoniae]|uniref:hypothetical protein n=1 Tax=Desulfoscipio gibsoniae TaxID=102134 RepID=UPI0012FF406B|nr:hypothetical protein [Desulfoscipio gibsoniae]
MIKNKLVYWITGTALSLAGVVAVRTMSAPPPALQEPVWLLCGYTLAITGLFVITLGTRR